MKKTAAVVVTVLALAFTAACDDGLKPGPAGRVVTKDTDTDTIHHARVGKTPGWDQHITSYYLTTKDPADGSTTRFEVGSGVYDHCYRGSSYPACAKR